MDSVSGKSLKILIVEDDAASRILLQRMLAKTPLPISEIGCADSLRASFELLDTNDFDVVMLDLNLPDSSGFETLVKTGEKWPHLAIVVVTGCTSEEIGLEAISMGAQEYLVKGRYDLTTLSKSVRYAVERKQTDRELRLAKKRYQTIFDNSAVAITMADENERLISWNKFAQNLLGMNEEDLYMRPVKTLYPAQEWKKIRSSDVRQKGIKHHLETRMIKKDGRIIDVDISLSVLKNIEGKTTGSIGVITDITEPKRIQKILDRKQKNLEAIFDAAPVGMLLIDENIIVKRANDVIKQMVRREYSQIIDQAAGVALGCVNSIRNDQRCGHTASCAQCPFSKTIQNAFYSETGPHKTEMRPALMVGNEEISPWLSVSAEPVVIDGLKHVVVAISDITSRKAAEQKLKETMELKSQFISTVSHELRTPLAALTEGVGIVLDGVAGRINKKQKKFLDIAKRNAERLSSLINDVLDFQKLEAGRMELNLQDNDIKEVARDVRETMALYAKKEEVGLALEFGANIPRAKFDRDKIIQVLTNLIGNAIKFTPKNGQVCVGIHRKNDELAITVSDTGIGIPKDDLPKVFERFYRVNRPGKQIRGTGLGLAIVNRIVAMHKGRIDVASEVGRGATFTVSLPLAAESAPNVPHTELDKALENDIVNEQTCPK